MHKVHKPSDSEKCLAPGIESISEYDVIWEMSESKIEKL
jgi:hypothetical protein